MTYHLKVVTKDLPIKFYRETLHRPWMRLQVFLEDGPLARTPEHYKKFFYNWQVAIPTPVHYIPEPGHWKKKEDGQLVPVQNIHLPLKYPRELHEGIWGGEAVLKGFQQRHEKREKVAHYWVPNLEETVVYSEILDKYMKVMVTNRALELIDQHCGLDNYILKTPPADLMSELTLKLKREMMYGLLHKTLYPDDPVKREEIYNKYKEFIIPEEEVEWYGLTLREANRKQLKIEAAEAKAIGPYKHIFRKELVEYLKNNPETDERDESSKGSILDKLRKLNIFSRSK